MWGGEEFPQSSRTVRLGEDRRQGIDGQGDLVSLLVAAFLGLVVGAGTFVLLPGLSDPVVALLLSFAGMIGLLIVGSAEGILRWLVFFASIAVSSWAALTAIADLSTFRVVVSVP